MSVNFGLNVRHNLHLPMGNLSFLYSDRSQSNQMKPTGTRRQAQKGTDQPADSNPESSCYDSAKH